MVHTQNTAVASAAMMRAVWFPALALVAKPHFAIFLGRDVKVDVGRQLGVNGVRRANVEPRQVDR